MDKLKTVLIANRGEIATRIIKTARKVQGIILLNSTRLSIRSIAIYTEPDATSAHVRLADESYLLTGSPTTAYLDGDQIIQIAKQSGSNAIIPGYGFLSENADFARRVAESGLVFVGPSPESIESFGLKHTARKLAEQAGVPTVPGSQDLLQNEEKAVQAARGLGFPVMLKATAGGGGMGLLVCADEDEVRENFRTVQSRGHALFKHAGVFLERYFPQSHHIEVQVFGNGLGKAISVGERECSIQRRHQKVIEECPSPFIENVHPALRDKLTTAAVRLAESINYASAGTIEYLVDDETGDFFFLEMNTRLQVEHGTTELCYDVDLVEMMFRQADAQLSGRGGLAATELEQMQMRFLKPQGHAIELRIYAENPARDYAPSPGVLQTVEWHQLPGSRIDTWVQSGTPISANYDPLLAKLLHHSSTRHTAIDGMMEIVSKSLVSGVPTNLDFLLEILQSPPFAAGSTLTRFLSDFKYSPSAIDVISGGSYTLIQDYPGRPTLARGFGHGGPMDPLAFQMANALVGNELGKEGLEITLAGPDLRFLGEAVVALCGPTVDATLDELPFPMWTRVVISPGQRLKIGKITSNSGSRVYLAVYGGFTNVAQWFGSKATVPAIGVGGYQGRPLRPGDFLTLAKRQELASVERHSVTIPSGLTPQYTTSWEIDVMGGPFEEGYLSEADIEMTYNTTWEVSHNAARGGIRLIGPKPKWARTDGGEGGAHPSNVIEYGYPIGGLNWTGDEPVMFPIDCPDFGGFLCSLTVISADFWKMGQLRAGNTVKFRKVSLEEALESRCQNEASLQGIVKGIACGSFGMVKGTLSDRVCKRIDKNIGGAVVRYIPETESTPCVTYRQGADQFLLVEYGTGGFDLNNKCRATALSRLLQASEGKVSPKTGLFRSVGCGNTLQIYYDGLKIPQSELVEFLTSLEQQLGDVRGMELPNRTFRLPVTFSHPQLKATIDRYVANQRPYASYLPDTFDFVAKNNAITPEELKKICLEAQFVVVGVGFITALPQCLPADPRHRLNCPKMNPSRTFTPEGVVSWGGSCMALYTADSPGGYMPLGMSIPGVDIMGTKTGFSPSRPWLFEDMDVITFYEVTEQEYVDEMARFKRGVYQHDISKTTFDMKSHNVLLEEVKEEVETLKTKRANAQDKMLELEAQLLQQWTEEKAASKQSMGSVEAYLEDPDAQIIEAPVNANVWKVLVKKGDTMEEDQNAAILEAMKMEINVKIEKGFHGHIVQEVLVSPGDIVQSGSPLLVVKREEVGR